MTRFGDIIKFIDFFKFCESKEVGECCGLNGNFGWSYSEKVHEFIYALRKINFRFNKYEILKNDKIDFWKVDFDNEDLTKYSAKALVSLLQVADDFERVCDGLFHVFWEKGWLVKILEILKTRDYEYIGFQK